MREVREGFRSSQLDLFAWRERDDNSAETVDHEGRPRDASQPNRIEPQDVAAMTPEALLSALESRIDGSMGDSRDLVALIVEVERRREAIAVPLLVRVCRRHAGFDRSRAVPEVVAALKALTAVGAAHTAVATCRDKGGRIPLPGSLVEIGGEEPACFILQEWVDTDGEFSGPPT